MSRTKIAYIILVPTIVSAILLWFLDSLYRQSKPYFISESSLFDSQVYLAKNSDGRFQAEPTGPSRTYGMSDNAVKSNHQASFKILPKATEENLTALCQWTSLRLEQLDKEIRKGGAGSNSQFCEEYDRRRRDIVNNQCDEFTNIDYQEFC